MKINPHRLRHLTIVALLGLAAACDDGNGGPTNNPSGSGGARATGGRGGGGGSATGGSGGMASSVTPVGQIAGNSDAGAATSVMVDAQATANNNTDPAKPADASVSDIGSNGMMMAGNPEAEWTIFVYGHADHNLSPSMVKDLGEMSQAKLSDKVQVVALVDYDASLENDSENFPTGTFWYRIVGDGQPPKEIAKGPELDLDSPSILASAVHQAFTAYPAKRYGLILWDHGGAWIAGFGGDTADGKKEGEGMAVESVANALREAVRALGLKGEKPLEFITFDTCLMGGAEELAAFQDLAKVYTANAEIDFGDGLDYTKTLNHLVANPNTSAIDLGKAEATIWDAHHVAAGGLDTLFRSHAVWDTAKTPKIVEAMKDLNKTISDAGQTRSIARALTLSAPEYFAGSTDESSVALRDLGNVLLSLKAGDNGAVANAANRVLDEIKNARLGLAAGELR
ncbi:MAG TPA: clostripain-related cysteine peptidase, partial [Polyangia bacterium]